MCKDFVCEWLDTCLGNCEQCMICSCSDCEHVDACMSTDSGMSAIPITNSTSDNSELGASVEPMCAFSPSAMYETTDPILKAVF